MTSAKLWSLWDMLKKFESSRVLNAISYIASTERKLRSDLEHLRLKPSPYSIEVGQQRQILLLTCDNLEFGADEYEIPGVKAALKEVREFLCNNYDYSGLDIEQVNTLHGNLYAVQAVVMNVLADTPLFVLTAGSAALVVGDKVGFGEKVEEAFPSAVYDTREASKCLGLERWTASVMHCMRALEPALRALEIAVDVDVEKDQWGQKIDQIESAIKRMHKGTNPKPDVQWYSEAAAQFHFVKNAWRNYAHHLLHTYDEDRATEIYDATRRFMRHLSSRLKEQV